MASLLAMRGVGDLGASPVPAPRAPAAGARAELHAHDYQRSLSIVVWNAEGQVLSRTGEAPTPDFVQHEGFATLQLGGPAAAWRAFSRWDGPAHERKITVLPSLAERDDLADDIAWRAAEPGSWLLPIVTLVLVVVATNPPAIEVRDSGCSVGLPSSGGSGPRQNLGLGLGHEVVQRVAAVYGGHFERTEGTAAEPARFPISLGPA